MQKINNELSINAILSKQNSIHVTQNQENFSDFLGSEDKEETTSNENSQEVDIFMQSLQNKAQLNRMIIDSVA